MKNCVLNFAEVILQLKVHLFQLTLVVENVLSKLFLATVCVTLCMIVCPVCFWVVLL